MLKFKNKENKQKAWERWTLQFLIRLLVKQRNCVFATNSDFLIPISLEPNVVDLRDFKLWIMLDQTIKVWNIYRFAPTRCKVKEIWKFEFVAKTEFLYGFWLKSTNVCSNLILLTTAVGFYFKVFFNKFY